MQAPTPSTVPVMLKRAEDFLTYVNQSRSPFHAADNAGKLLTSSGFVKLNEKEEWKIKAGGKYWFTRNQSSLIAFAVGDKYEKGNGFEIIGAHTDSPVLRVKPISNRSSEGYLQVGVETYGGGIWHTWFDRDLTLAGRVVVQTETGAESKLLYINRPILRIPSLAIHLDRTVNEKFTANAENHFSAILETSIKSELSTKPEDSHNNALINLMAKELNVKPDDIVNFELTVCDHQDSVIGGINNEFVFSGRLDNLMSSFCAVEALRETSTIFSLSTEKNIRMVALFDHEEIGSRSAYGAMSPLLQDSMNRILYSLNPSGSSLEDISRSKSNSFLISADMAHAVHPNYPEKHEKNHKPAMHKGPVIKLNVEQRYATTAETSYVIETLCKKSAIPFQKFVVRQDMPCGSTIGPITSSELGIRTVDIGNPQLAMHSIREMCGVDDISHCINLMKAFFMNFSALDDTLKIF